MPAAPTPAAPMATLSAAEVVASPANERSLLATGSNALPSFRLRVQDANDHEANITRVQCRFRPGAIEVLPERVRQGVFQVVPPPEWQYLSVQLEGPEVPMTARLVMRAEVERTGEAVIRLAACHEQRLRLLLLGASTPVANVPVTMRYVVTAPNDTTPRGPRIERSDADGFVTFAATEVGAYAITVADGYRVVRPGLIEVDGGDEVKSVFVTSDADWQIRGRVVAVNELNRGIAEVSLSVDGMHEVAKTDGDGRFLLPGTIRQLAHSTYFYIHATPPPQDGGLAKTFAGPFAWEQGEVLIELPPRRHVLELLAADAQPATAAVSYCIGSRGMQGHEPGWYPLTSSVAGSFELPWDAKWDQMIWLRLDEVEAGQPRHARLDQLPARTTKDAVVHRWTLAAKRDVTIRVQEERGAPVAGADVEVVFQAGFSVVKTATTTADYDPSADNPLSGGNHALLLTQGVTGSDGSLTVACAWRHGVAVRCKRAGFVDATVEVEEPSAELVVTMAAAGVLRGTIRDVGGRSRVLAHPDAAPPDGTSYESARLDGDRYAFPQLRVGTYTLYLSIDHNGGQHHHELGRVEIRRGEESEFSTTALGLAPLRVELLGEGLVVGDRIEARNGRLGFGGGSATVTDASSVSLMLPSGTYRLSRWRRTPDLGGHELVVFADESIVVRRGEQQFRPVFVALPGRVRLLIDGKPLVGDWVQVEDAMDAVVRTDDAGWASFASLPGTRFTLLAVHSTRSGWRPTGPRWEVTSDRIDAAIEAK